MATKPEPLFDLAGRRVWVAGHGGMVGGALVRRLADEGCELLTVGRGELDLRDRAATASWVARNKPQAVFVAAAKVGGILANDNRPAEFIGDNLAIESSVVHSAWANGVEKQPVVRDRKDRRDHAVPGLSPAVWMRFHLRHADQPLWPG
jgi:FlaA1/EpsC-like NDP-sugar epimerase